MFYINKDTPLDEKLLAKMFNRYLLDVQPKLNKWKKYYDGVQAIASKSYTDTSKPCCRATTNFCRNIVDGYCGYAASPGYISYSSSNNIDEVMQILRYNDFQQEDSEYMLNMLVYGMAAELMYTDANGQVRFRIINPASCFGVYDDSLEENLLYFVRYYKASEWDESCLYHVDVYSDFDIKHYTMQGLNGDVSYVAEEPHYFGQCPANICYMPNEENVFNCIINLQDAYNEILSSEVDDYSAFVDAFLALTGVDADRDDVTSMKENRVLLLPENAKAEWLTKNANDAQVENILKRLHESIYRIAQMPDFSSVDVMGNASSGIAIRFRLTNMESRASQICANMLKALQRRIEIICGIASLKFGEEVYRDINIDFKRNIPDDGSAVINMVNALSGVVSQKTLLSQIPFVEDVNAEIEAINAEKKANIDMFGFDTQTEEDDE